MLFYLGLALLLLALLLLWLSSRQRQAAGLPGGRVIYTDTRAWGPVEKPLYDPMLKLTGKPDYLIEGDGGIIPVEVKSGRAPQAPYDSHIYQLAAYCLLVENTTGVRPAYGILHYANRDFAVDYTPELRSALLEVLAEMRRDELRPLRGIRSEVARSHQQPARCQGCGFRDSCHQRLT